MDAFTIKDLENLSGIKAHTIRIWEQRYSFLKPQRTGTNIRYYSNAELKKILNVALLNKYGYKISHINQMSDAEMGSRITEFTELEAVQERIVNELVGSLVEMDTTAFESLLDDCILARGLEKVLQQIILPFLEKTGILWLTSSILPAQEHLVSNIIRQKLIAGSDALKNNEKLNKTALLFLPEDEYHEIGLLYMQYQFKLLGFTVIYAGANTTVADLKYIADNKNPHFIYSHIISAPPGFNFERFLAHMRSQITHAPFIVSGKFARQHKKHVPQGIIFCHSIAEVLAAAHAI